MLTEFFVANIALDGQTAPPLLFNLLLHFLSIITCFEIDDSNIGSLLRECDSNSVTNAAISSCNQCDFSLQLATTTITSIASLRLWFHCCLVSRRWLMLGWK